MPIYMSSEEKCNYEGEKSIREPFLNLLHVKDIGALDCDEAEQAHPRPKRFWAWKGLIFISVQLVLITLYTSAFFGLRAQEKHEPILGPKLTWSPVGHAVSWETRPVDGLRNDTIYSQKPSPEVDSAWHTLLENINLRITPTELDRLNYTSLPMADGTGYLATLGVYHELHCLKRLRMWVYKDHYYPSLTWEDEQEHFTHADHCLELLRQASICKADVTVTPFKWLHGRDGKPIEPTTYEGILHQCVVWDEIEGWAKERKVDLLDPRTLERPS